MERVRCGKERWARSTRGAHRYPAPICICARCWSDRVPAAGPIVCQLLGTEGAWGHVWNFAGSGTATQRELVTKIYAMAGTPLRMMVGGKTMLRLLGLFNPMMREMVECTICRQARCYWTIAGLRNCWEA